ncbi:CBS domain-containing protein [Streptodolium elevatio]
MTLHLSPPLTAQNASVADAMSICDLTISENTTVDEALAILDRDPTMQHLLVVDQGGRCEGVVTRVSLAAFLARSWYSQRTPVRDTHHQRGPFAWPGMPLALAAKSMRVKRQTVWPVADDDGRLVGVLDFRSVQDLLLRVS